MGAKTALEQNLDYMSKTLKYQDDKIAGYNDITIQ